VLLSFEAELWIAAKSAQRPLICHVAETGPANLLYLSAILVGMMKSLVFVKFSANTIFISTIKLNLMPRLHVADLTTRNENLTFVKTAFQVLKLKFLACRMKQALYPLHKQTIACA